MKDHLREFVSQNKDAFNEHSLDKERLWGAIEQAVETKKGPQLWNWYKPLLRMAALLVIAIGITVFMYQPQASNNTLSQGNELVNIDAHYKAIVDFQINMIQQNTELSTNDKDDFLHILEELDDEYLSLKEELELGINSQKIIEAIIRNYRKKIQLMEHLLVRSQQNDFPEHAQEYNL
ncbi:MAG: hypothetical protein COB60_03715 [Flavobacteriaceae bacterium]|nr:MAG: hypothetical protein COB60_03715 [Flavobacteriaceae bacterium]